jgi:hypothetical protein
MEVELADTVPDCWRFWPDWQRSVGPDNATAIKALEDDEGRGLGYDRFVGRHHGGVKLEEYCWPDTLRFFPHSTRKSRCSAVMISDERAWIEPYTTKCIVERQNPTTFPVRLIPGNGLMLTKIVE